VPSTGSTLAITIKEEKPMFENVILCVALRNLGLDCFFLFRVVGLVGFFFSSGWLGRFSSFSSGQLLIWARTSSACDGTVLFFFQRGQLQFQ
jgi:hypothetical protein